jgi:hypothetical protein
LLELACEVTETASSCVHKPYVSSKISKVSRMPAAQKIGAQQTQAVSDGRDDPEDFPQRCFV